MSVFVANELASILDSKISIGRINIGLLNRIIIDDLLLDDQSGKEMLKVTRLSAKFDILPLFSGKISISNIQLFGFNINLSKQTPKDKPNFQFVLDAFASKDTVQKKNNLDLRINSLLIRRGKVSYDVLSEKETPGKFNPQHLRLRNIIANISLKALQNDSINAAIKRLSIEEEHSGFELKKLSLKVIGNDQRMKIENFAIDLPNTSLAMDTIHMDYDSLGAFDNLAQDVRFSFHLLPSQIALQDLSAFVPAFGSFKEKLQVEVQTDGTINQLNCHSLPQYSPSAQIKKRVFDLVVSTIAIILSSPIMLIVALAIKIESGGPVFYKQERIGLRGKPFYIHKFRSMRVDADAHLKEVLAAQGQELGARYKLKHDPRITKVGNFIRKTSLDELPQVLRCVYGFDECGGAAPATFIRGGRV